MTININNFIGPGCTRSRLDVRAAARVFYCCQRVITWARRQAIDCLVSIGALGTVSGRSPRARPQSRAYRFSGGAVAVMRTSAFR